MPPRPHPSSDSQELQAWKARRFDEVQVDTLAEMVHKLEKVEKELAVFKGKLAVVMVLGSGSVSLGFHLLTLYLKH